MRVKFNQLPYNLKRYNHFSYFDEYLDYLNNEQERNVIIYAYVYDYTQLEISRALGLSLRDVYRLWKSALDKIKSEIEGIRVSA